MGCSQNLAMKISESLDQLGKTEHPVDCNQILWACVPGSTGFQPTMGHRQDACATVSKRNHGQDAHATQDTAPLRCRMPSLVLAIFLVFGQMLALGAGENRSTRPAQGQPIEKPPDQNQQTETGFNRVAYYVPSRIADFLDIWRFNVGFGLGLGINIRPTKGLQVGLAAYDSTRIGLRGRRTPFWHEWSLEGGFDGMYYELGETERGFHELGGTIHLILVGFDAAFDIEEALDFAYGLFLSDPADDDFR